MLCMKQTCTQCHFLMKQAERLKFRVTQADRDKLLCDDWSWTEHEALGCYMGVWDEGYGSPKEERKKTIVETGRRGECFFWPFKAGIMFPAGETLQKREWELNQAKHDRRLTKWVAVVAIVSNVLLTLANFVLTVFT